MRQEMDGENKWKGEVWSWQCSGHDSQEQVLSFDWKAQPSPILMVTTTACSALRTPKLVMRERFASSALDVLRSEHLADDSYHVVCQRHVTHFSHGYRFA